MGEAKRRGTFEERKLQAEERKAQEPKKPPISAYGTRRTRSIATLAAAALISSGVLK